MATYGWLITRDVLGDGEAGTAGPRDISPETLAALKDGQGAAFRMLDDDGELYYEGRIIWTGKNPNTDQGFEPLDDFGMPNAGCTSIQYRQGGKWETL